MSSTTPPAAFQGKGQNAILDIYQVRQGSDPVDWAGEDLTAASFYDNSKLPTVVSTSQDDALSDFTKAYPPLEDGMYQLRMFYGRANYGLYSEKYPTAVIQIKNNKWTVVQGGQVTCKAATATSNEVLTGVVPAADASPNPSKPNAAPSVSGSSSASVGNSTSAGTEATSGAADSQKTVAAGTTKAKAASSGSSTVPIIVALVFVAIVAIIGGALLWRRHQLNAVAK